MTRPIRPITQSPQTFSFVHLLSKIKGSKNFQPYSQIISGQNLQRWWVFWHTPSQHLMMVQVQMSQEAVHLAASARLIKIPATKESASTSTKTAAITFFILSHLLCFFSYQTKKPAKNFGRLSCSEKCM